MIDGENVNILNALKNATKMRNVKVMIIFDKADKSRKWGKWSNSPKKIISKVWNSLDCFPVLYAYDHKKSNLHAKFLLVDNKEILVTSANITDREMTRNLEMGIRHKENTALHASDLIKLLIEKKIIVPISNE